MTPAGALLNQLTDRKYLRRNLIAGLAAIALVAAIVFGDSLSRLFDKPIGTRAATQDDDDLNRIWETLEKDGAQKAAHSKMIAVTQGGKKWLYVIGGRELKFNVEENRYQEVISNSVRRIELHPTRNSVIGTAWEGEGQSWGEMNFGHMEFGLVESGGFIYVVAGDINIPPVNEINGTVDQSALLYSTVERLNLANPNQWEVYALLAGVNFYPEVLATAEGIHVVGGVYGNPFPPMTDQTKDTSIQDMLDVAGDYDKWNDLNLKNKIVIGDTGLFLNHTQTNGTITTTDQREAQPGPIEPLPNGGGPDGGPIVGPTALLPEASNEDERVQGDRLTAQGFDKIYSPEDGEEMYRGYTQKIHITYVTYQGSASTLWIRSSDTAPWVQLGSPYLNFGYKEYYVDFPSSLQLTDTYKLRVCPAGTLPAPDCSAMSFESEGHFKIADPSVTFTSPVTNDEWYHGSTYNITWDINAPPDKQAVSLWWRNGTGLWQLIVPSASGGSYAWKIDSSVAPGSTQIRACIGTSTQNPQSCAGVNSVSNAFTVKGNAVAIQKPDSNTSVLGGSILKITWSSETDFTYLNIFWRRQDHPLVEWQYVGFANPNNTNEYNWRVPEELSHDAQVTVCLDTKQVVNYNDCVTTKAKSEGRVDVSEKFKIGAGISINVQTPNGGEVLSANTPYTVTWASTSPNGFDVHYSLNSGATWLYAGTAPAGQRSLAWTVPANSATLHGRIRVSPLGFTKTDISDQDFTIVGGPIKSTKLSEALIKGDFVTTVGEHFLINTTTPASSKSWELKSDYIGSLSNQWIAGTVAAIGHLRFMITTDERVIPVPQGRYGHKLVTGSMGGGTLSVIGGATWAKQLEVTVGSQIENFKTFWVIDDNTHPVYRTSPSHFTFDYGKNSPTVPGKGYQFVGNITYSYLPTRPEGSRWIGTNGAAATPGNYVSQALDNRFSLKGSDGSTRLGRAFFGIGGQANRAVIGGLENTPATATPYEFKTVAGKKYFRAPASPTARAERLKPAGWERDASYTESLNREEDKGYKAAYNLNAFGIGNKIVVYGGQTEFQLGNAPADAWETEDSHVPDYKRPFTPKTMLYIPTEDSFEERWFEMADLGIEGIKAEFSHVRVTPGISTLSGGSQVALKAKTYNLNGVELTGATCSWSLSGQGLTLGNITNTGVFTANPDADLYKRVANAVIAQCTLDNKTITGFADLGVYPAGTPRPEAFLSRVELAPESAILAPGGKREFTVTAYDQYYDKIDQSISYEWTLNLPDIGTLGATNQRSITFTSSMDPDHAGSYSQVLRAAVTVVDEDGNRRTLVESADISILENQFSGSAADSFASSYMADSNNIQAIYHFGGVESDTFQTLGLFGKGNLSGTITVTTSPISPDGYHGSDVTITLKNGLDEPVFQNSLGERYAAYLKTSRSADDLVTTDQTFNPGKSERVELIGERVGSGGHDREMVYFDTDGVAHFRIYSNSPTPGIDVIGQIELPGKMSLLVPNLTGRLVVQNIRGIPNPLESTIAANKTKIAADNTDQATVTVTLRDFEGTPVSGYHVKINSSRVAVDTITPISPITNNLGIATFTVKSNVKGQATIRAFFGKTAQELADYPRPVIQTLTLDFAASIASLIPNTIRQGETLPDVIATGNQTSWETGKTTVSMVSPNRTGIAISNPNAHIKANGVQKNTMTINAPDFANRQVNLTLTGGGSFYPGGTNSVTTNAQGTATFIYQSGSTPGIVKIKAQLAGGGSQPFDEIWFMLEDNRNHPYELSVFASPATPLAPGQSAVVRGAIYEYIGTQKVLITQNIEFTFSADKGTFDDPTVTSQSGVAQSTFTRGQAAGPAQLLVTTNYAGVPLGARLVISQTDDSNDLSLGELIVNQAAQKLTVATITATPNATVGTWIFRAITDKGANEAAEVVDYPFTVTTNATPGGPRITQINPNIGYRGTDSLPIVIKGENAFFQGGPQGSVIEFTSVNGSSAGITMVGTPTITPDEIRMNIKVSNTATMGYWNVKVTTTSRVAELAGDFDFLVTTPNDIIVDVTPSPTIVPRDGKATSTVTIFVGRLDRVTGRITPLPNVDVAVSFGGDGDAGKLNPITGLKTGAVAPDLGITRTLYTTDAGEEDEEVLIQATVVIDSVPVSNTGLIIKRVFSGYHFVVISNPASLAASGGTTTLTAEIKDREGRFVADLTPVEFFVVGVGAATPSKVTVAGGQGKATTPYEVAAQDKPEFPQIYAKATIEGVGIIISDPIVIPIGVDTSKYRLTVTSDRASVEAGSTEKANITATLTYDDNGNPVPVSNWPVVFSLSFGQAGDYLRTDSYVTDSNGQIKTQFTPGYIGGNVVVNVKPIALSQGFSIITKTIGQTVSRELSSISAVPKYVPADGEAFSVIRVTVRNANYGGIPNKSVTLSSSLGTIEPNPPTVITNALGQATFYVKSVLNQTGVSAVTATVDSITLTTNVHFEPNGSLIRVILSTLVPLEAKSYDRQVKLYLRQPVPNAEPVIDEAYYTDASNFVMNLPTIYLKPNTPYTYWAKGRFHLARTKPVNVTVPGTVPVDFTALHKGSMKGLLIADISPDIDVNKRPLYWHDNAVNAIDVSKIIASWFRSSYEADFVTEGIGESVVNSLDFTLWTVNYGSGEPLP